MNTQEKIEAAITTVRANVAPGVTVKLCGDRVTCSRETSFYVHKTQAVAEVVAARKLVTEALRAALSDRKLFAVTTGKTKDGKPAHVGSGGFWNMGHFSVTHWHTSIRIETTEAEKMQILIGNSKGCFA